MTKFTRELSRQIDQAVKETIVKRLTYLEALYYIKATQGCSINAKTYFTKKAKLKQDAVFWTKIEIITGDGNMGSLISTTGIVSTTLFVEVSITETVWFRLIFVTYIWPLVGANEIAAGLKPTGILLD